MPLPSSPIDDDLLFRYATGGLTPEERDRVTAWRKSAPEHEARLRELSRLLGMVDQDEARLPASSRARSAAEVIAAVEQRRHGRQAARRTWIVTATAAAAVIVATVLVSRRERPGFVFGAGEFVTGATDTATVALGDGSVLRLAPNSRVRLDGSRRERAMTLTGHAYFAVAKMPELPFRVRTAVGVVTVLGTKFDLDTKAGGLSVVVVEGRVALATRNQQTTIESGQMSGVSDGRVVTPRRVADLGSRVAWVGNLLVFQSTSLAEVAAQFEARYHVRVEITDSTLAKRSITTWLSDQTLEQALTIVCTVAAAECSTQDGTVRMSPR